RRSPLSTRPLCLLFVRRPPSSRLPPPPLHDALPILRVAQQYKTVVVMSGKEDVICDGVKTVVIDNGDVWLPHITGTGCMSTSLIANFASVTSSMFDAAIAGMSTMGIAGEYAKEQLREEDGIGTFRMKIMDRLFVMTGEQWATKIRMYERSIDVV